MLNPQCASVECGFAVGEIVKPFALKSLIETQVKNLLAIPKKSISPTADGGAIVETDVLDVADDKIRVCFDYRFKMVGGG